MEKKLALYTFIIFVLVSCAHHRSGNYVFVKGKWVFKANNVGFSNGKGGYGRIDYSPYEFSDTGTFIWPVPRSKKVSSYFGRRKGRHHDGVDIPAVTGTHIVASASGIVTVAGRMRGYGNIVIVKHPDGYHTVYAHNSKHFVKKGQKVSQGEVIANVGSTGRSSGPHLHFEIRRKNKVRNPAYYLARLKRYLAKK
jgi:murein DD-endopeptidase MepM/ murein hydrolase activator NlpD